MAKILAGIKELFSTLGKPDIELNEEKLSPKEERKLKEMEELSGSIITNLEQKYAKQKIILDTKERERDRLGNIKPQTQNVIPPRENVQTERKSREKDCREL